MLASTVSWKTSFEEQEMSQMCALHSPEIIVLVLLVSEILSLTTGSPRFPHSHAPFQADKGSAMLCSCNMLCLCF